MAQLKTVEGSKEGRVNGGGGMEGGGITGWLPASKPLSALVGKNQFPSHPPTFPFSHCLSLIYRCPAEFYSPMRMDLFSCDLFCGRSVGHLSSGW